MIVACEKEPTRVIVPDLVFCFDCNVSIISLYTNSVTTLTICDVTESFISKFEKDNTNNASPIKTIVKCKIKGK